MPDRRRSHHNASAAGRDTALTTDMANRIYAAMLQGLTEKLTAQLVGVSKSTLDYWLWRGKHEANPLYINFRVEYYKAKAEGLASFARVIHAAAHGGFVTEKKTITSPNGTVTTVEKRQPPDARAAQWVLERRLPGQYGPNRLEMQILTDQVKVMSERLAKLTHLENEPGAGGANQSGQPDTGATPPLPAGPGGALGSGSPPHGSGPSGGGSVPFEL